MISKVALLLVLMVSIDHNCNVIKSMAFAMNAGIPSSSRKLLGITDIFSSSETKRQKLLQALENDDNEKVNNYLGNGINLIWALKHEYSEIVEKLLSLKIADTHINDADKYGETPLIWCTKKGDTSTVEKLLHKSTIEVNKSTKRGMNALLFAVALNRNEIVDLLLARKDINVFAENDNNADSFLFAAYEGEWDIFQKLTNKVGIDINKVDNFGYTSLMLAAYSGSKKIVKYLLKQKNIDINRVDKYGNTALMLAAVKGQSKIGKMLLNFKKSVIDVNKGREDGCTVLMMAAYEGNVKMVKELLKSEHHINVNVENKFGFTALDFAKKGENAKTIKLLKQSNAKSGKISSAIKARLNGRLAFKSKNSFFDPVAKRPLKVNRAMDPLSMNYHVNY